VATVGVVAQIQPVFDVYDEQPSSRFSSASFRPQRRRSQSDKSRALFLWFSGCPNGATVNHTYSEPILVFGTEQNRSEWIASREICASGESSTILPPERTKTLPNAATVEAR
jgi:hypothetical protein